MGSYRYHLYFILLWLTQILAYSQDAFINSLDGCSISAIKSEAGIAATFYSAPSDASSVYTEAAFYAGGYQSNGVIGSGTLDNLFFNVTGGSTSIGGVALSNSGSFVAEMSGYFYAATSGIYEFDLKHIDDGAMVFMGAAAYDCCVPGSVPSQTSDESVLWSVKGWNTVSGIAKSWVYLEGGFYYPIRVVYINVLTAGSIELDVIPPNETTAVNVGEFVHQLLESPSSNQCSDVVVSTVISTKTSWIITLNKESTYTSIVTSNGSTYVEEYVYYPSNFLTSYTTIQGTGSTTAYSTTTQFVTYLQQVVPAEIVYIEVPAYSTITTTSGTVAKTITTYTVISGITSSVVYNVIPAPSTIYITDNTITKTSTSISLITTVINGTLTTTSEYVVYVPSAYSTLTTIWNILASSTMLTTQMVTGISTTYTTTYMISGQPSLLLDSKTHYCNPTISYAYYSYVNRPTATISGIVYGYQTGVLCWPYPTTKFVEASSATTTWVIEKSTTYIEIAGPFSTTTSFGSDLFLRTSTWYETTVANSTYWVYQTVMPSPQTIYSIWSNDYPSTSTKTIYSSGAVEGLIDYVYLPSYSISYSEWSNTYLSTIVTSHMVSNSLSVFWSTYIYVERPSLQTYTSTWTGTYTTQTTTTTLYYTDGQLVTSTQVDILVPNTEKPSSVFSSSSRTISTSSGSISSRISSSNSIPSSSTYSTVSSSKESSSSSNYSSSTSKQPSSSPPPSSSTYLSSRDSSSNSKLSSSIISSSSSSKFSTSSKPISSSSSSASSLITSSSTSSVASSVESSSKTSSSSTFSNPSSSKSSSSSIRPSSSGSTISSSDANISPSGATKSSTSAQSNTPSSSSPSSSSPSSSSPSSHSSASSSFWLSESSSSSKSSSASWKSSSSIHTSSSDGSSSSSSQNPSLPGPTVSSSSLSSSASPNSSSLSLSSSSILSSSSSSKLDSSSSRYTNYTPTNETHATSSDTSPEVVLTTQSTTLITTNSICTVSSTETTSFVTTGSITTELIEVIIFTPPATCNMYYTTEVGTDCEHKTYTTFIGTTDASGKYINATLIVNETPMQSCLLPTDIASTLPTVSSSSISSSSPGVSMDTTITTSINSEETRPGETTVTDDSTTITSHPASPTDNEGSALSGTNHSTTVPNEYNGDGASGATVTDDTTTTTTTSCSTTSTDNQQGKPSDTGDAAASTTTAHPDTANHSTSEETDNNDTSSVPTSKAPLYSQDTLSSVELSKSSTALASQSTVSLYTGAAIYSTPSRFIRSMALLLVSLFAI